MFSARRGLRRIIFLCSSGFLCFSCLCDAAIITPSCCHHAGMFLWRGFPRCHAFIVLSCFYGAAFIPPSCFHRAVIFPPFHRVPCFHRAVNVPRRGKRSTPRLPDLQYPRYSAISLYRAVEALPRGGALAAPWDLYRVVEIWMRGGCLHGMLCLHGAVDLPPRGKRSTTRLVVL